MSDSLVTRVLKLRMRRPGCIRPRTRLVQLEVGAGWGGGLTNPDQL